MRVVLFCCECLLDGGAAAVFTNQGIHPDTDGFICPRMEIDNQKQCCEDFGHRHIFFHMVSGWLAAGLGKEERRMG